MRGLRKPVADDATLDESAFYETGYRNGWNDAVELIRHGLASGVFAARSIENDRSYLDEYRLLGFLNSMDGGPA